MVASFVGLAALFVGLNAYFVGIIQILVYAEPSWCCSSSSSCCWTCNPNYIQTFRSAGPRRGLVIPFTFVIQLSAVLSEVRGGGLEKLPLKEAAEAFYDQKRI